MITLYDMNRSWIPPEQFQLVGVEAVGAYLQLRYNQVVFKAGTRDPIFVHWVFVYLNDMGREVLRTADKETIPVLSWSGSNENHKPQLSRWNRFCNGLVLILTGIGEMFKCLNKSSVKS